mmetsp:Transcript_33434/g.105624  ORF Transcript_33434/g.105624 Transcript_33434/m.105624 type:complete len:608 (-) Transcript_33434:330-2153(-)|eukprot:CAMPEP_0118853496 /NCGR_PEP_ID=MMETSP1163-20130328/2061_1 /TAXON_ID=124430 /ORGANISM="Phaeomonas parva, Strain CCMP2877" /LENGTH=607 /DNA_ID=CAMNT_0006786053 /DNA_START=209 /DNA_END=2032 /DNA_ORIENTATION=-
MAAAAFAHSQGSSDAFVAADDVSSPLEVYISAKNLPHLDTRSNSDPFAVVYLNTDGPRAALGQEIARTEVVRDNPHPAWTTPIAITYLFEAMQRVTVRVYDEDAHGNPDLDKHDYIGEAKFTVGELMGVDGGTPGSLERIIGGTRRSGGTIQVYAEEAFSSSEYLSIQFGGKKLANKDGIFGRSDPYLIAHRLREDGGWMPVWKSEVVMNDLSPTWQRVQLPLKQLCNGDKDRPLRFEVWDFDKHSDHDYMGSFETSVNGLLGSQAGSHGGTGMLQGQPTFPVVEEKKRARNKRYTHSGEVYALHRELLFVPTFMDYLKGGLELSMVLAVDFTASNGAPSNPRSLHYMAAGQMNAYQSAIENIGEVLEQYDSDKHFPVYGFGGRVGGQVSHCFQLAAPNGNLEVRGVAGLQEVYSGSLNSVALSGPTLFTPILRQTMSIAQEDKISERHKYTVLVIITDGMINDMSNTIDALVEASVLPMSVIIVGVGAADFSGMEELDGDDGPLVSRSGVRASRDIVQFVPVSKFGANLSAMAQVKHELLVELPRQLTKYYAAQGIPPNQSIAAPPPTAAAAKRSVGPAAPNFGAAAGASAPPPPAYGAPPPSYAP